jgi:hydroxymethylpyrimidine/phosphomethylpyrimidine kinase
MQIIRKEREKGAKHLPVVVDPVLVSTSGHSMAGDDALQAMKAALLPVADVLTPNLSEASALLGSLPCSAVRR